MAGRAFATGWRVTVPSGRDLASLRAAIDALLAGIDRTMSPWRHDSEITRLNAAPAGTYRLSRDTLDVAASALDAARVSGGWFDPTVGPLVARWGFGPIEGSERADWRGLSLADNGLAKDRRGLTVDLCGIAKGYALDRMLELLVASGHDSCLVDLGGELAARGRHPSGRPWQVAVEDPRPGHEGVAEVIRLERIAVATSGSRAQSYRLGGNVYGHIVDPFSRTPADGGLGSVTVTATDAMTADAWATALAAAGPLAGPNLARSRGIDALFLITDGSGLSRQTTCRFHESIV
jgi:thiamine biosynthesis lipoprotein